MTLYLPEIDGAPASIVRHDFGAGPRAYFVDDKRYFFKQITFTFNLSKNVEMYAFALMEYGEAVRFSAEKRENGTKGVIVVVLNKPTTLLICTPIMFDTVTSYVPFSVKTRTNLTPVKWFETHSAYYKFGVDTGQPPVFVPERMYC
ncbi:CUN105 hypothetical protein [Culex nigripalpus nucleopolyhedrovirus]|uniref:Uncharacterized protein n=1 Tax=Culex nigripalpus nucleopolyhedrovirus (isolate Florida/1997) TaxID=645993 RepID=Q919H2_NPVCO|nr:CUN105 hypothetical protein [Culex nigripalpus nucleopolyhedrovirus]AAK94183.1 CUN105 hypothetical protein [Culex nigripalpus nucleopolyhedrovirus]